MKTRMDRMNWVISAVVSGLVLAYALLKFGFFAMNAEQFIELVRKMRMHQNAYYRNGRKQSDLIASKELEKEVDRALLEGISFPVEAHLDTTDGDALDGDQISLFE